MEHTRHVVRNDHGRLIASILILCLIAAAGYALQHTISCFLLSWIIAYLLDPFIVQMERKGIKRFHGLCLLYIFLAFLSIFFLTFMVPKATISWNAFTRDLPLYIQKIQQLAHEWETRLPGRYGTEEMQWMIDTVSANVDTVVHKAGQWGYTFVGTIVFNVFNVVLSPILVFFMLFYKQTVMDTMVSWIPEQRKVIVVSIGKEVNRSIGGYLRGQVIVSIIVAVISSIALFFLGVPHPIFCGMFAGAASILPFIGIIIALIPALFFAWVKFQTLASLTQVSAIFAGIYFFEGYLIKPLVFKESMNLNPLVTIIMVMALGELLGFWGILLALPIAGAIKITWGHFLKGDFRA